MGPRTRSMVHASSTTTTPTSAAAATARRLGHNTCSWLVDLPDAPLLQVMTHCAVPPSTAVTAATETNEEHNAQTAAVQRTLCSAARAHSRLHATAVSVLNSISIRKISTQQQLDSALLYLTRHGQHIHSLDLQGKVSYNPLAASVALPHLPPLANLTSLSLEGMRLQLLPAPDAGGGGGNGQQQPQPHGGVLPAVAGSTLKHLAMRACILADCSAGLEAALAALPALDSLSLHSVMDSQGRDTPIAGGLLQQLPHLTRLDIRSKVLRGPNPLQHIAPLTGLLAVELQAENYTVYRAGDFAPLQHLTSIKLGGYDCHFEPMLLESKSALRHLDVSGIGPQCALGHTMPSDISALLTALQPLTQLTYLNLHDSLWTCASHPSLYSALTSSTLLQHLDLAWCRMTWGMWQYLLPTNRRLPQMRVLNARVLSELGPPIPADLARIAQACPALQQLTMTAGLEFGDRLHVLSGLTSLQRLEVGSIDDTGVQVLTASCPASLRALKLEGPHFSVSSVLSVTCLTHLTELCLMNFCSSYRVFTCKAPGDAPVTEQLQHLGQG